MSGLFGIDDGGLLPLNINREFITENSRAEEVSRELRSKKIIALDTETTALDPYMARLLMLQLSDGKNAYVIDARKVNISIFKDMLEDNRILKIIQNACFDLKILKVRRDITVQNIYDTMLVEQIINAGISRKCNLQLLVKTYFGYSLDKETRDTFEGFNINREFNKQQIHYASDDVAVLSEIYKKQLSILKRENLIGTAKLEFDAVPAIVEMETCGVKIDHEQWRDILKETSVSRGCKLAEIRDVLEPLAEQPDLFGHVSVNINSPEQMVGYFNKLGIDILDTSDDTLKNLEHPLAGMLSEYREYEKILTSFGEDLLSKTNPITGRIHPHYQQLGAFSGRFSCSNPNLQQIPSNNRYRHCFVSRPGFLISTADYSQQELRIAASASKDPIFMDMFFQNMEVHSKTAEFIFGVPWQEINKARKDENHPKHKEYKRMRGVAKSVSFLSLYGGQAYGLSRRLGVDEREAQNILDKFYAPIPKLKAFMKRVAERAVLNKYVENLGGRKRYFQIPHPSDSEFNKIKSKVQRVAVNHIIQSSAADMMKKALALFHKIYRDNKNVNLMLTVHDEIATEHPEEDSEEVAVNLNKVMNEAFNMYCKDVPNEIGIVQFPHWHKD